MFQGGGYPGLNVRAEGRSCCQNTATVVRAAKAEPGGAGVVGGTARGKEEENA